MYQQQILIRSYLQILSPERYHFKVQPILANYLMRMQIFFQHLYRKQKKVPKNSQTFRFRNKFARQWNNFGKPSCFLVCGGLLRKASVTDKNCSWFCTNNIPRAQNICKALPLCMALNEDMSRPSVPCIKHEQTKKCHIFTRISVITIINVPHLIRKHLLI